MSRPGPILVALLGTSVVIANADASSLLAASPAAVTPTKSASIAGSGFGASEAIDVYFDTTDTALSVSNSAGSFGAPITIPATATPGKHYVTAIGRKSGDAAQIAITVTTPWTEHGFGAAHLGSNPYENTLNSGNVGSLGILWQISANGLGSAPIVSGGRVFVSTGNGVEAVSSASGSLVWKVLAGSGFYASPALVGSTLYIGTTFASTMYALSATTGATIWSKTTGGGFESSAVVVGGVVYAGCLDDKVYAFSASSGQILWTYTTGGAIDSSPAVVNGVLYIGSNDDSVYALNAATGALIWSYKTGGAVESSPAVSNGVVYVGSDDHNLYAISAAGPNVLWSHATGGEVFSAPAVANGLVYFGSVDGKMYAGNAYSGALQWSFATGGVVESPVVANGVAYVSSRSGGVFALDATYGTRLAAGVAGYSLLGNPTVSDGVIYLNTDGDALAFALRAGVDAARPAKPPFPSTLRPDLSLVAGR